MARTKQPSGLHAHLGYWLRAVSNAVSHSFARKVEAEGVTVAEWVFLRMLYDADDIPPSLLADRMGMTKGAISKLSDRLIVKGFVERQPNPDDQRAHTLSLKAPARALVPRLAKIADQNDEAFFDTLSATERRQLEQLLRKIVSDRQLTNVPTD
jgi:MarR family transcriptional regulator, lower aerobic nicotinate degradation pathway regulator